MSLKIIYIQIVLKPTPRIMCKQKPDYFIAAANNDMKLLNQHINKSKNTFDRRSTNIEMNIFSGFGAIHYAAYHGNDEILRLLLPYEIGLQTSETQVIVAPGFGTAQAKYKLADGSNCLMIALLRKHISSLTLILDYIQNNQQSVDQIVGQTNSMGLTNYIVASICNYPEAIHLLLNPTFIQKELFLVTDGDMTPSMNACFFGRHVTAICLGELFKNPEMRDSLTRMILNRDTEGQICVSHLKSNNFEKFGVPIDQMTEIRQIMTGVVYNAYQWAQGKPQFELILKSFMKDQTIEQILQ
uniref:Ankyrin repeats-containing protein n=1 Tax=Trepomonas sp. PC1 TaxID=1076344 RepID=A0A146KEM5_9EUKA|eukprot:JAP95270.1 Ankyrin repeats-containing protein [Trepomonas sp. PC1]